jgi:hypothetical protein
MLYYILYTIYCIACQKAKIHSHISPQPVPIPIPERHLSHIHVDLVGPLPPSQGFTHIFTIVDRTTHWAEAVPLITTTATACAEELCYAWIYKFGIPNTIMSDRGTKFTSSLWSQPEVTAHFLPAHFPHHHHNIPPTIQWDGGMFSPPSQRQPPGTLFLT